MVSTVEYFRPSDPAEGDEYDAFLGILPDLRATHGGQYVAICGGDVIASGTYCQQVFDAAKRIVGDRPLYCEWVEPPEGYTFFIGGFTVLPENR